MAPSESVFLLVAEVDFAFKVGIDFVFVTELVMLNLRFVLEPGLLNPQWAAAVVTSY